MRQIKRKEYEEFEQYLYNKNHGYIWTPDMIDFICRANEYDPERIGKQMLEITTRYRNEHITHMRNDKNRQYVIRTLRNSETALLQDFLYEAIYIPEGTEPPSKDILEKPELRVYTDEFGTKHGDNCLVADFGGKVVGAVWSRIMNDYGHIGFAMLRQYDKSGWFLWDYAIDYKYQNMKYGTRALKELIEIMKERKLLPKALPIYPN